MLQIGIIGLGQSGKTTVFNALCFANAKVGDFSLAKAPNIAVIKVPDKRLNRLAEIIGSGKISYPEIEFIDIAGMTASRYGSLEHPSEKFKEAAYIHAIRMAQALLVVVRCFEDDNVPHPLGSVDPARDITELELELIISDLMQIEKRMEKLRHLLKVKPSSEHKSEMALMERMKAHLEEEKPLRELEFSREAKDLLAGFGFLSQKQALYLLNLGEEQIAQGNQLERKYFPQLSKNMAAASLCGKIEMEIAALDENERGEFIKELGIDQQASIKVIKKSFDLLGLISFLTGNEKEVHAWPIPEGLTAIEAAGEVHSDIQRGFIKAEVIDFEQLDTIGDWATAKKQGKVRLEGKDYIVRDGDVILYRFNV